MLYPSERFASYPEAKALCGNSARSDQWRDWATSISTATLGTRNTV